MEVVNGFCDLLKRHPAQGIPPYKHQMEITFAECHKKFLDELYQYQLELTPLPPKNFMSRTEYFHLFNCTPLLHLDSLYTMMLQARFEVVVDNDPCLDNREGMPPRIRCLSSFANTNFPILQWDGVYDVEKQAAGAGMVYRYPDGRYRCYRYAPIAVPKYVPNKTTWARLVALNLGLKHAHKVLCFDAVKIVGSSEEVINVAKSVSHPPAHMYNKYSSLFQKLREFRSYDLKHIFHKTNGAANYMANLGVKRASGGVVPPRDEIDQTVRRLAAAETEDISVFDL